VDDELNEFVVCPSCGTRIKAGREFCLRCFGPLPTAERPIKPPIWVSLGLSDTKKQVVAGVVAAAVIGLGAVIYITEPQAVDDTARPYSASPAPRNAPAAAPAAEAAVVPAASAANTATVPIYQPLPPATGAATTAIDVAALEAKRKTLEDELAKSPDDVALLNDVAVALDQLGRAADAVPRFERAIGLAPDQARLHMNFAHALSAVGLWDRAVAEMRDATRLRPTDYFAQYTLAQMLHQKGDDQGAAAEFQKAVKMRPNESSGHLSYGVALETLGRRDEAIQEYKRYLALQAESPDAERLREHLLALGVAKEQP
jgi:Flp pilus assembly protein TadD